jgi:tetratricopeptide (TPR) repeat protein
MRVQVSYLRQDDSFYRALVEALEQAGVYVWSDEILTWDEDTDTQDSQDSGDTRQKKTTASHNTGSLHDSSYAEYEQHEGHEEYDEDDYWEDESVPWDETVASSYDEVVYPHDPFDAWWDDEGNPRFSTDFVLWTTPPVHLVLLSHAALASPVFTGTLSWIDKRVTDDPVKLALVVTAGPYEQSNLIADDGRQLLSDVKRIEAPSLQPLPLEEAVRHTLETLCLTPAGEGLVPVPPTLHPQPVESTQDLLVRGNALFAQARYTEALPFFEQATRQAPERFAAWFSLEYTLFKLQRWSAVVAASEQATALDPTFADAWILMSVALIHLERIQEGLAACERALALKPRSAFAWSTKGIVLSHLSRYDDALAAYDEALLIDPTYAGAWNNKGVALNDLKRYQEALDAVNQAFKFNSTIAAIWDTRAEILHGLHRDKEALPCFDRAIALDPQDGYYWRQKARSLRALGSTAKAEEAEWRAQALGG